MKALAAAIALCFMTSSAQASGARVSGLESDHKSLYFGAGMLLYNTGQYSNQVTGQTGFGAVVLPDLSLMGRLDLGKGWGFSPLLSYTPLGHKSPDGGESTTVLRIEARVTRSIAELFEVELGLGMANASIRGSGGTVQLNNGNGVSTFGFPSGSSSSNLFYWEAGAGIEVSHPIRIEGAIFATGPLSSSRTINYTLFLSYGFL